jgi:hypothetical protein
MDVQAAQRQTHAPTRSSSADDQDVRREVSLLETQLTSCPSRAELFASKAAGFGAA